QFYEKAIFRMLRPYFARTGIRIQDKDLVFLLVTSHQSPVTSPQSPLTSQLLTLLLPLTANQGEKSLLL
ncbi:MAG: hypothetical protein ACKO2Z_00240, partial [Sphaerospermopsis kisseleviana]